MHSDSQTTDFLFKLLRQKGCRITPVVTAVINHLFITATVRTAQQLREQTSLLLGYEVSFPTIYRVLERLLTSGVICSMYRSDGLMRYYICRNPQCGEHHHFICSQCMRVQEIPVCFLDSFTEYVDKHLNATVDVHFIQLEGICAECRKK